MTDKVFEDITLTRARLVQKFPFFGYIALATDIKVTTQIATAAVDGLTLSINPDFFSGLNSREKMFVVAHEVMHLALRHVTRREWRDAAKWNIAADLIVNEFLAQQGIELLNDCVTRQSLKQDYGIDIPPVEDTSAEEVYDRLKDLKVVSLSFVLASDIGNICTGDNHDNEASPLGSKETISKIETKWKQVLRSAAANAKAIKDIGDLPGWLIRDIEIVSPKVDWRALLTNFVASSRSEKRSFRRPSRRHLWRGDILASKAYDQLNLLVAVDVSGSISQHEYWQFIAEVLGIAILKNTSITMITFDTRVTSEHVLHYNNLPDTNIHGGGGTSFVPVFEYADKQKGAQFDGIIVLTDGYGVYPDVSPVPTLWVLTENHQTPPWGICAVIEDQQQQFEYK